MARAWVIRAGARGEHEQWNIDHQRATVGWSEIGDISGCTSKSELHDLLAKTSPGDPDKRVANFASQLWALLNSITIGDLIILPSKIRRGYIWFGRATGTYGYDPSVPDPERRKFIPVDWLPEPISRSSIESDLLNSLNASQTVFAPSRNEAVKRLEAIAATGIDPRLQETNGVQPHATAVAHSADDEEVTDPALKPSLESIVDRVRAHVTENFREHDLTWLVADILSAYGFQCTVSPPGPDGGVDIIAGKGPLGMDSPIVVVEVKSEPRPIDSKVVRGLHSAREQHKADQALLVAWGGLTGPARREFHTDRAFRVWDGDALLDALFSTYELLPSETKAKIPLKRAWLLDEDALA
ncbi:restriction endonuclease [Glutamicibacter creatinolyticus]|uniref:restriction endonuclease n=1 Tax=Glutamicibacter creatinolyticus TaxID=162496 RepID=UPI0031D155AC